MADPHDEPENPVRIEDLLRLKRAERPNEAFWEQFDRQLHQRMLQSLVKKDPWWVQVGRGLSGRVAQSLGVAATAALLALVVVRPAFVSVESGSAPAMAEASSAPVAESPREVAMADFEQVSREYRMEGISADEAGRPERFRRDFAMDAVQVANHAADYSSDIASAWPAIGNAGVASLVY